MSMTTIDQIICTFKVIRIASYKLIKIHAYFIFYFMN